MDATFAALDAGGRGLLARGELLLLLDRLSSDDEAAGIEWLADIGDSPETAALFDSDGEGLANLVGCNEGWGCQVAAGN